MYQSFGLPLWRNEADPFGDHCGDQGSMEYAKQCMSMRLGHVLFGMIGAAEAWIDLS